MIMANERGQMSHSQGEWGENTSLSNNVDRRSLGRFWMDKKVYNTGLVYFWTSFANKK